MAGATAVVAAVALGDRALANAPAETNNKPNAPAAAKPAAKQPAATPVTSSPAAPERPTAAAVDEDEDDEVCSHACIAMLLLAKSRRLRLAT